MRNLALVLLSVVIISGCATGRNVQSDLDAINSKNASLQSQLEAKNRENANLQDQVRALGTQLQLANRAKADVESRLYQCLDKLSDKPASKSSSNVAPAKEAKQGYIK